MSGLSLQSYVNPLTGTLTKQPETQTRMPTPALQSGLPPLWVRSFLDICHDFCDCVLCGFYGWIHPAEVRHSREKRRLGYESYMFSVRKQKFFIPFLPVGLLLPSMLFMKPFISIKEFWGWSFIPLFVWRTDIVLFSYSWMWKKAPLFSEACYK